MDYLKYILVGVLGIGVGAATGYFYAKEKYEKEKDEEVEEIREYYKEKLEKSNDELKKTLDAVEKYEGKAKDEQLFEDKEKVRETGDLGPSKESHKVDYNKVGKKEMMQEENAEKEHPEEEDSDFPYLITQDEFENDRNEFDKVTLTYYIQNDTLTDENDEPIIDVDELISTDIYNELNDIDGDVFVRNASLQTDFEIDKFNEKYEE